MFGDQNNGAELQGMGAGQVKRQLEGLQQSVAACPPRTPADRLGIAIDKIDGVVERLHRLEADIRGDDMPPPVETTYPEQYRPSICLQYVLNDGPGVIEEKLEIAHHALDKLCEMLLVDTAN